MRQTERRCQELLLRELRTPGELSEIESRNFQCTALLGKGGMGEVYRADLGEDMTDREFGVVRMRNDVGLAQEFIGSLIEIHRSKNRAFDLK